MKALLLSAVFLLFIGIAGYSQSKTNVGSEFWIAFPPNQGSATIQLYISSEFLTSGTISSAWPGINQNFSVTPGIVTQITLPNSVMLYPGTEDKGIHIVANDAIAVYGLNNQTATTDAFMAIPVNSLGTDYRVLTYSQTLGNSGSAFSIVATHDATNLTIYNHQTGLTSNIILNSGQTHHVETNATGQDLTGSRIQADYPVSVFGSVKIVNVPAGCSFGDHVVEQMFPVDSWGMHFVTVPLAGRDDSGDLFRILAAEDGTDIEINGTVVKTLSAGSHFDTILISYNSINSSKATLLAQFAKGEMCSGGLLGDPFMMLILPREQYLKNYTVINVSGVTPFNSHFVNLVAPQYATGSIYQDGVLIPSSAFTQIGSTNYYGAQRTVSQGSHTFNSVFPFGVSVYGWRTVDSYGYPGGGSMSPVGTVSDITLTPDTSYGTLNLTNVCLTAHVTDDFNNPVAGILVNFNVTGVNPLVGSAYTDAGGDAIYCYTQTGIVPGTDHIEAETFSIHSDTVAVIWTAPCTDPMTGGTISAEQSGCRGFTPQVLTSVTLPAGFSGTPEYKWQQSVVSAVAGFTDIPASGSPDYAPGALIQTTWFRRLSRVSCSSDWSTAASSNVLMIAVEDPVPVSVSVTASPNPFCPGSPVTFTAVPVNGGASPSWQWKVNGMNAGTNASSFVYNPQNNDSVRCILTSDLTCVTGNPAGSQKVIMTANPAPAVSLPVCFDTITTVNAKPIQLKGGLPPGGIYTGPGVNSLTGIFTPNSTGIGIKTITYTSTNYWSCQASAARPIRVVNPPVFSCGNNYTDIRDGRLYSTVQIGSQCWMAEDLDYGITVPVSQHMHDNCVPEKYRPSGLTASVYQWDEMMNYQESPSSQGICPPGWHVPAEAEWISLFSNWSGIGYAGSPLKSSGYSGFNSTLTGVEHQNQQLDYSGFAIFYWTSTLSGPAKALSHGMNDPDPSVSTYSSSRQNGFAVRCIMD